MKYMEMVCFQSISTVEVEGVFTLSSAQSYTLLDCPTVIPSYVLLEATFQTAGRVAREALGNRNGGLVVQLHDFKMRRPLFFGEYITIKARIVSHNKCNGCSLVSIFVSANNDKDIVERGYVIIKNEPELSNGELNNTKCLALETEMINLGLST